jgi:energy-coupling factor transporter ATP-binding protein EcfA2
MKIRRLTLHGFTVFRNAVFDFAPGVNVLIGENGTGKSHALKLIYALTEAARYPSAGEDSTGAPAGASGFRVSENLTAIFQPDEAQHLVSSSMESATLVLEWDGEPRIEVSIGPANAVRITLSPRAALAKVAPALFLPPREVLSIFPGFAAAWVKRESAFDRTYYDLCMALDLHPLRSGGPPDLVEPLERELGGKVIMREGRFFVRHSGGDMEAPLLAEGDRKLAMIAHLLTNGSIAKDTCLLWDEPEANLNPKRARLMGDTVARLANGGVQVFLATHDYALTSELALKVDTGELPPGSAAFFALHRERAQPGVSVERGERLADLQDNPILDALVSLHAREEEAAFAPDQAPP